ncbi:DUF3168 domain-containing protein [Nisaea sp.]|uniref:DUF3168 domain-containing protein n=1 Tax=Nisaea sp. TaxID=2024842 RepID=UPI003299D204
MAEPSLAVWDAVYGLLKAGMACGVYDEVPEGAAMPYVVMSRLDATDADSHRTRRGEYFIYLSVWSSAAGQFEVLGLIGQIDAAVHATRPQLATGRAVSCRVTRKSAVSEPDGRTYQGQVTIRCIAEH